MSIIIEAWGYAFFNIENTMANYYTCTCVVQCYWCPDNNVANTQNDKFQTRWNKLVNSNVKNLSTSIFVAMVLISGNLHCKVRNKLID